MTASTYDFEEMEDRVLRGTHLLDGFRPGWRKESFTASLDMASPECCVLGLLYGTYEAGIAALELFSTEDQERYGFLLPFEEDEELKVQRYRSLTELWKRAIEGRDEEHIEFELGCGPASQGVVV